MARPEIRVEESFASHPRAARAFWAVQALVGAIGPCQPRVTKSRVALPHRAAFACLWLPGRWLRLPGVEVVLSMDLGRLHPLSRFEQAATPPSVSGQTNSR